jgi:hypothetical protein
MYLILYYNQKTRVGGSHHKNGRSMPKKKILNRKFHNTRSVGKPRTRWDNVVQTNPRNTRLEETSQYGGNFE